MVILGVLGWVLTLKTAGVKGTSLNGSPFSATSYGWDTRVIVIIRLSRREGMAQVMVKGSQSA